MKPQKPVIFEPHPVTPERKAELHAAGYKIIDARFAPREAKVPVLPTRDDIAGMKRGEVVEWLKAHGVDDPKGPVADLRDDLSRVMFADL